MTVTILTGDCRDILATLPERSVHTCVTSPPYWGLRDYGVDGQIGQETSMHDFVAQMVAVFREVRRVLRDDGTLWLNLGDSYAMDQPSRDSGKLDKYLIGDAKHRIIGNRRISGLKPKNLCGIPWRVAFALQEDGWYLRSDIIWHKPNPMPESVEDRCTKSHEYIFHISKSERYYFDAEAIAEPADAKNLHDLTGSGYSAPGQTPHSGNRASGNKTHKHTAAYETGAAEHRIKAGLLKISDTAYATRNKRDVWTVSSKPYHGAHFATFPPDLIVPCILAGSPPGGMVLDPFGGAGTTGLVANRLGRDATLIELNPEYAAMTRRRIDGDAPLLAAL